MVKVNSREDFLKELSKLVPAASSGVEIGVLWGDFSRLILDIINPKLLLLIDPYMINKETYGSALNYSPTAYSTEVDFANILMKFSQEIIFGQVMIARKFSYDVVKRIADNTYDFVYHDGSHLYHDVKRDLNDWLPKLKDNGIICGHDYVSLYGFGVVQAVDEFCKENNFEMIILNSDGGDWAIKKKITNE
jgi:hypothetical protein